MEGIEPERFRGRVDIPLSELGRQQAAATAERLAADWRVGAVFTSPLGRCVDTASLISDRIGKRAAVLDRLNDIDYGDWQWLTREAASAQWPPLFKRWNAAPDLVRFPHGESLQDLAARAADAVRTVVGLYPNRTVAVVSHDSVIRVILIQLLLQPLAAYWRLAPSPCGISEADIDGERVRVLRINETAHLRGLEATPVSGRPGE